MCTEKTRVRKRRRKCVFIFLKFGPPLHVPQNGLVHCQPHVGQYPYVERVCACQWCRLITVSSYLEKINVNEGAVFLPSQRFRFKHNSHLVLFSKTQCLGSKWLPVLVNTNTRRRCQSSRQKDSRFFEINTARKCPELSLMDPVVSLEHMFKSFVKNIHLSLHLCPNIHT